MNETKVEVHIWGVLIGFFIGYAVTHLAWHSIKNRYDMLVFFSLGLLLMGVWFLGIYYALGGNRDD